MRTSMPDQVSNAIRELAIDAAYTGREILHKDALEHVDQALIEAWNVTHLRKYSAQQLLAEVAAELTDADATTLLASLHKDTPTARTLMLGGLRAYIAHDLKHQARERLANMEPSERQLTNPAPYDDPVRRDRRALARAATAAERTGREAYFDVP